MNCRAENLVLGCRHISEQKMNLSFSYFFYIPGTFHVLELVIPLWEVQVSISRIYNVPMSSRENDLLLLKNRDFR